MARSAEDVSGFTLKLNFFDLSGAAYYREVRAGFLLQPDLLLLCFDVNVRQSFERLPYWLQEAGLDGGQQQEHNTVVCVCGCMSGEEGVVESIGGDDDGDADSSCGSGGLSSRRRRQVLEAEGRAWSKSRGFLYYDVSAKTGRNVDDMFDRSLQLVAARHGLPP